MKWEGSKMKTNQFGFKSVIFVLMLSISACTAGAKINLKADKLEKPISMTEFIHSNDKLVLDTNGYDKVGTVELKVKRSGHFWNLYNPNKDVDLSEQLNKKMEAVSADGIVNFKIVASGSTTSITNTAIHLFGGFIGMILVGSGSSTNILIGIPVFIGSQYFPGTAHITVTGELVKFKN